jgi:hypothetical protein
MRAYEEGSTMAIMAPSGGPLKAAGLQGKSRRVRGSVPFGGVDGLVCLVCLTREVLTTTGAWPPPLVRVQTRPVAAAGVHDQHPWPHRGTSEVPVLQAKWPMGKGAVPLGCADELEWLS